MDSFDQLIELAHEAKNAYKKFMGQNLEVSIDKAFLDYIKSVGICKDIQDRLDKVEMRREGGNFGYDNCAYYMAKDWLNGYQYAALVVLTEKLGEKMKNMAEQAAENKQKETLKTLIKEAVREAKKEEQRPKRTKTKKTI